MKKSRNQSFRGSNGLTSYLQRQKNGGYHRANYRNIVNYARKLVKLNFDDAKAVAHLRNQIAINKRVTERGWFLKQLEG